MLTFTAADFLDNPQHEGGVAERARLLEVSHEAAAASLARDWNRMPLPKLYPPAPRGTREVFHFWDADTGTRSIIEARDESAARAKLAELGAFYGLPLVHRSGEIKK